MWSSTGNFLIVEDDRAVARTVLRICRRFRPARVAETVQEAESMFSDGSYVGLVLDLSLPDGHGLNVLRAVRETAPFIPALVLTGELSRGTVNDAYELRAEYLCKPARRDLLVSFVRRAATFEQVPDARIAQLIDQLSTWHDLSPRETDIVACAVANKSRAEVLDHFGITENTLKKQIHSLLKKCSGRSLDEVARRVLLEALHQSRQAGTEP